MRKIAVFFFAVALGVLAGRSAQAEDPPPVTLSISVTNPSPDQTREMDFSTELPEELKKADVLSSDGLELAYDPDRKTFSVQGKVNLQPGETTYYRIQTRDVWVISEKEFAEFEKEAGGLASARQRDATLQMLGKIRARQGQAHGKVPEHIAVYRENRKEFDALRKEILNDRATPAPDASGNRTGLSIFATLLGALAAAWVLYLIVKSVKLPRRSPGNFLKLSSDIRTECILLPLGDVAPSPHRANAKERGITLVADRRYPDHAVLEIKVFLPGSKDASVFTGFIVRQSPLTTDGKARFEVSVSLVEAGENSFQRLSQYVQTHPAD